MFTKKLIESLPTKNTPYRRYEKSGRAGFGIQISPKGTKTFFYAYKVDSKQRFMKLGIYGEAETKGRITLKVAGEKWLEAKSLKSEKRDPQVVRDNKNFDDIQKKAEVDQIKLELSKQGTYEQLLENYISFLKENRSERSVQAVRQAFNANAYKVIDKHSKAKEITSDELNDTLALIERRGASVMTNRMRSYLSASFSHGIKSDRDRLKTSTVMFGIKINPLIDIPLANKEEKPRDRNLSDLEIKTLWEELDNVDMSNRIRATIKLLLVTGQRVTEVLRLNINDIDMKEQLWELKITKNGKGHGVPLPEIALELIKELVPNKQGYYMHSVVDDEPMKPMTVSKACARFCKQTDMEKFTPRDLRRTWKTLTGKAGISKFDRDLYQNHARQDVSSKSYDRYEYLAEKRTVAIIWNDYLMGVIKNKDSVIVPINKQA